MEKFNDNLKQLLEQVTKVFPEQAEVINSHYNFENAGDVYLKQFYANCRTMGNDVSNKNEIIFSQEFTILENVDFYSIWNSEKLNKEMKQNIWKYLHTLYIYAYEYEKDQDIKTIIKELKKMSGNPDEMDDDSKTLLNIIDSLTGRFEKAPEGMVEEEEGSGDGSAFENFAPPELLNGMIGDLAKEIADEINPEELNLDDPSQLLKDLMSGNFDVNNDSSGITNLVKNITGKIQNKLAQGDLDESALFAEAQNVMKNFGKGGGGGGQFGKIFETMMQSGMASSMDSEEMSIFQNAQNIINSGGAVGNAQDLQNQYERKKTKDRLRAKLEEKKRLLEEKEKELAEKAQMQADYEANVDLDALAAEIEAMGSNNSSQSQDSKKSKKSKKKKH